MNRLTAGGALYLAGFGLMVDPSFNFGSDEVGRKPWLPADDTVASHKSVKVIFGLTETI